MNAMKKLMLTLAAALALAPLAPVCADDAPAAKPRKKLQMKTYMNQLEKAKADAAKNETPILVFVILDADEKSTLLKRYLLNNKIYKQFAQENFATLILKGQKAASGGVVNKKSFGKKGEDIVNMNYAAVDAGINSAHKVEVPASWKDAVDEDKEVKELPEFIANILVPMNRQ